MAEMLLTFVGNINHSKETNMKTREQLKGEVEDIREELQHEYYRPRQQRLVRELEVKRRAIRCHEIMMGIGY